MQIEKIFKNLILIDFAILVLIVISSMYQPNEFSEIYQYLDNGILSNYKNFTAYYLLFYFFYIYYA